MTGLEDKTDRGEKSVERKIPEILYSGTSLSYLVQRLKGIKDFCHGFAEESSVWRDPEARSAAPKPRFLVQSPNPVTSCPVFLSDLEITAISYALKRSRQYDDNPAIILVKTSYLHVLPRGTPCSYKIPYLNYGSYCFFPLTYFGHPHEDLPSIRLNMRTTAGNVLRYSSEELHELVERELAQHK